LSPLAQQFRDVAKDPCFDFCGFTPDQTVADVLAKVVQVNRDGFEAQARASLYCLLTAAVHCEAARRLASAGLDPGVEVAHDGYAMRLGPDGGLEVRPMEIPGSAYSREDVS
jgi:hypothetical protein